MVYSEEWKFCNQKQNFFFFNFVEELYKVPGVRAVNLLINKLNVFVFLVSVKAYLLHCTSNWLFQQPDGINPLIFIL